MTFIQYFHKKAARTTVNFLVNKVKHRKIVFNIIIPDDFRKSVWLIWEIREMAAQGVWLSDRLT